MRSKLVLLSQLMMGERKNTARGLLVFGGGETISPAPREHGSAGSEAAEPVQNKQEEKGIITESFSNEVCLYHIIYLKCFTRE